MSDEFDDDFEKTSVLTSDTFKMHIESASNTPPSLVLLVGPVQLIGKQWTIEQFPFQIGRSSTNDCFIADRSVSGHHAEIVKKGDAVIYTDLGSTNKTAINKKEVVAHAPYTLQNNDQIKMGNVIVKFLEQGSVEAVANQQTFDRGQKDALTGLYNKGAMNNFAPEVIKRSDMVNIPVSLIVFDIDHFKKVNDTYGHVAGDYVIKELARIVKTKLTREEDFIARFGGEEFVLVLSNASLQGAAGLAERVRSTVEEHHFEHEGTHIPVTVSLGVATREPQGIGWGELFERADQALYKSKKGGRNKVSAHLNS